MRYWLSIFSDSVQNFSEVQCLSNSILGINRAIFDYYRCHSQKMAENLVKFGEVFMKKMAEKPTKCQFSYFLVDLSLKIPSGLGKARVFLFFVLQIFLATS